MNEDYVQPPVTLVQRGNLGLARAHWVARDTVAWPAPADPLGFYKLHFAPEGGLGLAPPGGVPSGPGDQTLSLLFDPAGLDAAVLAKFPHLAGYAALKLN